MTQTVGTQSREVRWDLYGDGQLNAMTYGSRHWEYQFIGLNAQAVMPPLGPAWAFSYYGTGYLATITTPGGGQITYQYADTNGRVSQRQRGAIGGIGNYQYSTNGHLASETAGTYAYTGDSLLDSTTLNAVTTRFAYDGQGWRVRKLVEQGPTSYYSRAAGGPLLSEWVNTSATSATARDYIYAGSTLLSVVTKTNVQPK